MNCLYTKAPTSDAAAVVAGVPARAQTRYCGLERRRLPQNGLPCPHANALGGLP
jgi:hypothetical protein